MIALAAGIGAEIMNVAEMPERKHPLNTQINPQSMRGPWRNDPESAHDKLVKQTQQWVGLTFFAPMLKQMRESPFRADWLDGGRGGQAFAEMYDEQLSMRMARGAGSKLVNSIVRRIEGKKAYQNQINMKLNSEREGADRMKEMAGFLSREGLGAGSEIRSGHVEAPF
jgi:Rod binding domain-containing protein